MHNLFEKALPTVILSACAVFLPIFIVSGFNPIAVSAWIFGPIATPWATASLLNSVGPLVFGGLGAAIAIKSGIFNLGGEGQAYVGAFVFSLAVEWLSPGLGSFRFAFAIILSACSGAALASISSILKKLTDAEELITTFLVSLIAVMVLDWAVAGPCRDPASSMVGMKMIPESCRLIVVSPGYPLNGSFISSLVLGVAIGLALSVTGKGFRLRLTGTAPEMARYAGLDTGRIRVASLAVSGGLHALAGAMLVAGSYFKLTRGGISGIGWNSLAVSLIAANSPFFVILVALLFAWLDRGAESAMLVSSVPESLATVSQGLLFLVISARSGLDGFLVSLKSRRGMES